MRKRNESPNSLTTTIQRVARLYRLSEACLIQAANDAETTGNHRLAHRYQTMSVRHARLADDFAAIASRNHAHIRSGDIAQIHKSLVELKHIYRLRR